MSTATYTFTCQGKLLRVLDTMGLEADLDNKRKWFSKVAWPSSHGLDQAQKQRTLTKPAQSTWRECGPWTTYPHRSSTPPRDPRATAACQHSEKVRQTWKAKAFDEMTRSTEKALREGTPAEKKVALQVANAAAGAIASVGGPHTRKVAQSDFQREDLQGHGQQRWQQNKLLTRSWWQACELSATRARNGTGSLASQSTR